MGNRLPDPRLRKVYRLDATLGAPLELGEVANGQRRIVPQAGGTAGVIYETYLVE